MNAYAKTKKVLLITNIPTPYRIPLFNELNSQLDGNGIKLKVVFGALTYARRKWAIDMSECKFDHVVLPSKSIRYANYEKSSFTYSGLYQIVSEFNPSAIITNGFSIATTKLWLRRWFASTPYIIWSGDIYQDKKPDSLLRKVHRKLLIARASGFIAYGSKAKQYLVSLGADTQDVRIGINTVDTQFYTRKSVEVRNNIGRHNTKKHLLYVGHLSPRKNVLALLKIAQNFSKARSDFILDIVGDGEDLVQLEKYVLGNQLAEFVKFHGFKQKTDIALSMAQADCFLFQTDFDIWGLVLVEAMAAGLACIASIHAGATQDLIKDGVTGFAMDFSETARVAKKIDWLLENPHLAKQIGQNASRFVDQHISLEKAASGFVETIRNTMKV